VSNPELAAVAPNQAKMEEMRNKTFMQA